MPKLTKKYIDTLVPREKNYTVWDNEIRGFGARVWPSGKVSYVLKYRTKHHRQRKLTIGAHGSITPDGARDLAQQYMTDVIQGNDPAETKTHDRESPTIADLCDRFIAEYSKKRNKPSTTYAYEELVRNKIKPALGHRTVNAVQRIDISKLHHELSKDRPYIANRTLALLSKMFNMAEMWGLGGHLFSKKLVH
jgi:hypothetical protein